MTVELIINHAGSIYAPLVCEDIQVQTERRGSPGKLKFTVLNNGAENFSEGDAVRLSVDGKKLFYGFIFTQKRTKSDTVQITAYDQIRYLKNKDTYTYTNKTASDFLRMVARDYKLQLGTVDSCSYRIPSRVEDNETLLDMIENALDQELLNKKQMYVLYDDCGRLCLRSLANMKLDLLIDNETAEDFDYGSSIDSDTYNRIKLSRDNENTGKRDVYIAKDTSHINKWGILQYTDTLQDGENGKQKADSLLKLYNSPTRTLKISGALGDTRVRGGSLVAIMLNLGDMELKNYMLVENCKHTFTNEQHTMDLTLRGGEFIA